MTDDFAAPEQMAPRRADDAERSRLRGVSRTLPCWRPRRHPQQGLRPRRPRVGFQLT
jgi:hypothetical protein